MKKITVIQRILYQYRVDFYRKLKEALSNEGIALELIVEENKSQDKMEFLEYFHIKKCLHLKFFGYELIFQPYFSYLKDSNLLLLELNNKLMLNYLLIAKRFFSCRKRIAFWGHVINKQAGSMSLGNIFKRVYFKCVDFWFPYTEKMAGVLKKSGFRQGKMITIYNTIDTVKLKDLRDSISDKEVEEEKARLGINGFPVGIFCGRIYKEKRIDFLLEACVEIKNKCPDFSMIFIGDGEESHKVKDADREYSWIKYIGPAFDRQKALYFKMADVFLSPGLVGLSIIESFASAVPMVTTDYPYHSAEIEYLKNQENGIISNNSLRDYVQAVCGLLADKAKLEYLKNNCHKLAQVYTMENMVQRLTKGIKDCLDA